MNLETTEKNNNIGRFAGWHIRVETGFLYRARELANLIDALCKTEGVNARDISIYPDGTVTADYMSTKHLLRAKFVIYCWIRTYRKLTVEELESIFVSTAEAATLLSVEMLPNTAEKMALFPQFPHYASMDALVYYARQDRRSKPSPEFIEAQYQLFYGIRE